MYQLSRRKMFGVATSTALGLSGWVQSRPAHAADFTLKYANNAPAAHPLTVRMKEAAEAIRAETNGKVDLQVYFNSQLGGDTDMLAQLRAGGLDFFTLSPLILSSMVPKAAISGIGFAFSDYQKVFSAMDGELGAFVRSEISKAGLHPFEKIFNNGFRQITTSTRAINQPADLKNLKIRVPPAPLWTSMFKSFDAAPLSINFAEVYSSLQTKIADAQENPLVTIDSAKLYEVQKFLSKTNHMWDGFWFLASGKTWNKLPADVRQVIEKQVNRFCLLQREDVISQNVSLEKHVADSGVAINSVDSKPFQAKLKSAGFYKEWQTRLGDPLWALLEKSAGASL
ncbi:TRAP transporter substrate-binding protein [Variovorax sp. RT4R15]|uniref:TRAP transporter substrate-binding protein n=1 Tax=Variovorax sp. RT4R15 TaxID=3443737 RepID=UPI003F46241B